MRAGLIEAEINPVTYTLRHKETACARTLTDDELRALWAATAGGGDYARIVRLCLLTGCRRDEIGGLLWEEVLSDRLLIGPTRMKGAIEHEVPLLTATLQTLPAKQPRASGAVFGRKQTGFSGWSKSKELLDAQLTKIGTPLPHWTLHDLRRTFSTRLHNAGIQPLVAEALLAHRQQGVAAVYNRADFWDLKCAAMKRWHGLVAQVIEGNLKVSESYQ
jgi:integrase